MIDFSFDPYSGIKTASKPGSPIELVVFSCFNCRWAEISPLAAKADKAAFSG